MKTNMRHAEWGHWGITLWQRENPNDTYLPGRKVHYIPFPVGNAGPCDLRRRDEYKSIVREWVDHGCIPCY